MRETSRDIRTRKGSEAVRSYRTRFAFDEVPLQEGGIWLNGRRDGVDWTDIYSAHGVALGALCRMGIAEQRVEQGNLASSGGAAPVGDYDDPTAILAGVWGPNQHGTGIVFSRNQTEKYFQEVEIRLRSAMQPHRCTGYEVFWRCLKNENAYAEIVRWNGKIGEFTSLKKLFGPQYGVSNGDTVEATISGNEIRGYINGVEVISATDDVFRTGSPGIGFNFGVGNTNVDHGFTYFDVDTYAD